MFGGPFCPPLTSDNCFLYGDFFYLIFFLYGSVWWSLDHLTQKPAWLCFAALFLWPFSISPILRVLSFKVFPKCQFHFLVLQIITIPLLIRAVRLRHPSSPLLGWAASSQVQTSQCDLCFLTSGNIVTFFSPWFPLWVLFTSPKNWTTVLFYLHPLYLNIEYVGFI